MWRKSWIGKKATKLVKDAILKDLHLNYGTYNVNNTFKELKADSLSLVEVSLTIEESLDGAVIKNEDLMKVKTVEDVISLLEQKF